MGDLVGCTYLRAAAVKTASRLSSADCPAPTDLATLSPCLPVCQHVSAELPVVLGRDLAGVVHQIGPEVTLWQVGDPVWAAVPFWRPGTLAEFVVLEEKEVRGWSKTDRAHWRYRRRPCRWALFL